ncbi:hypothetical protein [Paraglaciecola arctica]|uniref:Uncharacterized protein n=1 Tax=Paraglaciecola arctica BSs20135 TaxID=493475 RepID=K6Y7N6_9ALTE|nr:hypothetical protein [Paraglaciecola arctica]GAC19956.1 hypothetical protein GARC_2993 [Paraglaciecola arctica BSs20135]
MNIWFTSNLGDPMLADEALAHIKAVFLSQDKKINSSNEMSVFFRHESTRQVHCQLKVYFSPATIVVAKAVDAIPCKKPSIDGLGLLVGSKESWSVLFPRNADF